MRGRKQKPTLLKALHGSDQPRNPDEPRPSGELSAHGPLHFDEEQRAIWREALAAAPPGMLRRIDASVVETWVIAVSLQRRCLVELAREDGLAGPAAKRLLTTLARAGQAVRANAAELGFSPASRPRVHVAAGSVGWRPAPAALRDDDGPRESIEEYLARGRELASRSMPSNRH